MLKSSARRPSAPVFAAAVTGLALALALAGCAGEKKVAAPEPSPTPIADLDPSAMEIPRIEFCPLVPRRAVTAALGGKVASEAAYGNGDEEELPGVGTDVVHEIGCSWTGAGGTTARAWVFARPVDAGFAKTLVAEAAKVKGCRSVAGSAFGAPSTTQQCTLPTGENRVRHAGLFGQTWLTCELASRGTEPPDLRSRTDQWCVETVNALNTTG